MGPQQEATNEPSIEEILDSIRQIIADDDESGEAAPAENPVAAKPAEDDIIELTEKAPETKPELPKAVAPPTPPPPEPPPAPSKEVEKPNIQVDMQEPETVPAPPPVPVKAAPEPESRPAMTPPPPPESADSLESILTKNAEAAAIGAFSELAQKASVEKGGKVTIEDVVRYEIRPLLRAWIDKYLPGMVERLVQKELEKISRRFDED